MEDSFVSNPPRGQGGACGWSSCACGGAAIPRGAGYLWITRECAEQRLAPALVCEQGARGLGLVLETASRDAQAWWSTGTVPRRPTPLAEAIRAPAPAAPPASAPVPPAPSPAPRPRAVKPSPSGGPWPVIGTIGAAIVAGLGAREIGQVTCFLAARSHAHDTEYETAHMIALAKSVDAVAPCGLIGAVLALVLAGVLFDRGHRILAPFAGAFAGTAVGAFLGYVIGSS